MSGNEPDIRILNDEKEYPLIGQGNTAEIYDYSGKVILKLFREGMPRDTVLHEERCAEAISRQYPDTPRSFGVVRYRNRLGILYEKVSGTDMTLEIFRHPFRIGQYGKTLAELQLKMHKIHIELPYTLKEKLTREITFAPDLTEQEKETAVSVLREMPENNRLCHNDLHPGNIMITADGYTVIDWLTASSGAPAADVARSLLLMRFGEPMHIGRMKLLLIRLGLRTLRNNYLRRYLREGGITEDEIRRYMLPVAAARLSEWLTQHERKRLIRFIQKEIADVRKE